MKKVVFLTGATGNMGWAGFQELYRKKDRFRIRVLARHSKKNIRLLERYMDDPDVEIVWGDLTVYEDVLAGVAGADYVLHVGGMVSPKADYYPEKTLKVNVTAAENVVRAVKAQRSCTSALWRSAGTGFIPSIGGVREILSMQARSICMPCPSAVQKRHSRIPG